MEFRSIGMMIGIDAVTHGPAIVRSENLHHDSANYVASLTCNFLRIDSCNQLVRAVVSSAVER